MGIEQPYIQISWGELFDRLSILEIKRQFCTVQEKLVNIEFELQSLTGSLKALGCISDEVLDLSRMLKEINQVIWETENIKRACESEKVFSDQFIEASRQSYIANDQRAQVKRRINELLDSEIIEEKIYKGIQV